MSLKWWQLTTRLVDAADKEEVLLQEGHDEAAQVQLAVAVLGGGGGGGGGSLEESAEEIIVLLGEDECLLAEVVVLDHVVHGPHLLASEGHHQVCKEEHLIHILHTTIMIDIWEIPLLIILENILADKYRVDIYVAHRAVRCIYTDWCLL